MAITRSEILANLRAKIARNEPIIGGGAGTGISAKCEEAGGIDLIVIYNSGRYRMAGRGSLAGLLAYGNANVPRAVTGAVCCIACIPVGRSARALPLKYWTTWMVMRPGSSQ